MKKLGLYKVTFQSCSLRSLKEGNKIVQNLNTEKSGSRYKTQCGFHCTYPYGNKERQNTQTALRCSVESQQCSAVIIIVFVVSRRLLERALSCQQPHNILCVLLSQKEQISLINNKSFFPLSFFFKGSELFPTLSMQTQQHKLCPLAFQGASY